MQRCVPARIIHRLSHPDYGIQGHDFGGCRIPHQLMSCNTWRGLPKLAEESMKPELGDGGREAHAAPEPETTTAGTSQVREAAGEERQSQSHPRIAPWHPSSQSRRSRPCGDGEEESRMVGGGRARSDIIPARVGGGAVAAVDDVRSMVEREFAHHDAGVARLNNGSFGSVPRRVLDAQEDWNARWLRHPDAFCWDPLSDGFLAARRGLAALIGGVDVDEVVLLENATTGAAVVALDCMWSFLEGRFAKGDGVVMFNSTYGAVKKCFQAYCVRAGARLVECKMPFPVKTNDEILHTFEEFLQREREKQPLRLAVLDHITSMPSIVNPVRELVRLCRAYGVEHVFVDGAHGIGSVDVNVREIDADYYMANVHKWLFAPTVVAFFHAKAEHMARLHHPVTSHNYGTGLLNESYWVGTRDYSALLAVPSAIQFVEDFCGGLENYRNSNHDKVVEMAEMLATAWETCLGAPPDMCASMAMVGLPPGLHIHSQEDALKMRTRLREEFHVEVPLFYAGRSEDGSEVVAYARISHQVYNKLEDYHAFRDAVNIMLAQGA